MLLIAAGHPDVDGAEQGEDEGLDEGHQQLEASHKNVEEHGDERDAIAQGRGHLPEDEYQGDEA